jgi:glycosyltransferase involved in cell wall biosynthesis
MTVSECTEAPFRTSFVSIGLPVYNGERFLAATLQMLSEQDYPAFEIVVSDNASTDRTEQICREHARRDPRVRYHRADQNQGACWNFNRVFELSRGDYFMWAAHDDLWAPECVRRCVERLETEPEAVLCHSASQPVAMSDRRPVGTPYLGDSFLNEETTVRSRWRAAIRKNSLHAAMYGVIRRSALAKTHGLVLSLGADAVLLAELSLRGKIIGLSETLSWKRVPDDLATYRTHEEMLIYLGRPQAKRPLFPQLTIIREMIRALAHADLSPQERRQFGRDAYWIYATDKFLIADLKTFIIDRIGPARYHHWTRFLRSPRSVSVETGN